MFRTIVIVSLTVTCLVTIAAWALSTLGEDGAHLHFENGILRFSFRFPSDARPTKPLGWGEFRYYDVEYHVPADELGYEVMILIGPTPEAPAWPLVLMFACYPTLAFIRGPLRRWRRRRRGLCIKCGYNLERNVSGVCPECLGGRDQLFLLARGPRQRRGEHWSCSRSSFETEM